MSEKLSRERLEEIAARVEAASYDHEHDCDHYEYAQEDGRCYRHESGELCRYEPKCHDSAIRHSLKPSLVPHGRLAADVPALLAHISSLEAENERLRAVAGRLTKALNDCIEIFVVFDTDAERVIAIEHTVNAALAALDEEVGE